MGHLQEFFPFELLECDFGMHHEKNVYEKYA